jgi:hypothetical protein
LFGRYNNWLKLEGIFASYFNKYYPKETEWAVDLKDYYKTDSRIVVETDTNVEEET